jgi:hypothetical protein
MTDPDQTRSLSVVCVFNDPAVREQCLDRSVAASAGSVDVEYIPVDNVGHAFSSAGAALNHAARQARGDVVVFVHQDVYLHDLGLVAEAARHLDGDRWSILGAAGVDHRGRVVGAMRDRVEIIGADAPDPEPVDSLDEVLFMIRRDRVLEHPLTEDPELAWHAYAVEYGVRMRRHGLLAGATNLGITHNSLTVNLDKLDVAHRHVASLHPEQGVIRTTCGVVGGPPPPRYRRHRLVAAQAWRKRWLTESLSAWQARRHLPSARPVLADIRLDVDALHWPDGQPFRVLNLDRDEGFAQYEHGTLELTRYGRPFEFRAVSSTSQLLAALDPTHRGPTLLTGLVHEDLTALSGSGAVDSTDVVLGIHEQDIWVLAGVPVPGLPASWSSGSSAPLLAPRLPATRLSSPRG